MSDKRIKAEDRMTDDEKFITKVTSFISSHIKSILVACVVIFVFLIAIVVISGVSSANREKNLIAVSDYEDKVPVVLASGEGIDELISNLESCVKDKSYASQKAQYLIGVIHHSLKNYDEAYKAFIKAKDINPKIYLSDLSLLNAAVCKDDQGDVDKALELYKQVYDKDQIGISSRALFNAARIHVQSGNTDAAKQGFSLLVDKYPNSELAKIAQDLLDNM